ncbi:hypothetical protein B0A54_13725 [Friedmanniomyces endolithicus]|uniref:Uncharacterized protein n=1 Tax=Friedmanniomyces endolithicus TaxID=329885 RepID=A0A4U0UHL7_9PEZI|nr:hypothetical protein LTS09_004766 [Friedmanniomyces endolithicus]TKA35024.1 hypothetical protein B0A54_13725 [Friedmanniomyces endolithicus]
MELFNALFQLLLLLFTAPALETLHQWLHSSPRTISPAANSTFRSATRYTVAPPLSYSYGDRYTAATTPSPFLFANEAAPRRCDILHGSCEGFVTEIPAVGHTPNGPVYDFSTVFVWFLVVAGLCALGSTLAALKQRCESLERKNDMLAAESLAAAVRNSEALAVIERQDRRQARQDLLYEHSVQHIVKLEQAVSRAHAAQAVAISERDAACARIGELEKQEARRLEETAGEAKRLEQQSREHCGKITAQQIEIAGLKADLTTETEKSGTVATELQGEKTVVRALEQKLGASQQLCAEKETECQKLFINSKSLRAQIEQLEGNRGASGALCQMEDAETERLNALDGNEQVEQRSWVGDAEIPDPWEWSRRSLTDFSSSWKRTGIDRESAPEASNEDSASLCSSVEVVIATQHDPSPVREDSEDSIATHRDPSPTYEDSDVSIAAQRDPSPNGEITEDSIATPRDPSPSTIEQEPVHATPQATSLPSNPPISTLTARVADFVPFGSSNPFSTTSTTFSSGAQGSSAQGTTTKKTRRTQRGGRNRRKPKDAAAAGAGEQDEGADGNGDGEEAPGSISSTPSGRATSMPTANNNAQAPRLPGLQFWNPNGLMASRHAQH